MTDITISITPEILTRLQAEAERRHLPIEQVAQEALEAYLDDDDFEDTPDEEILASLERAVLDVNEGRGRPAEEALADLRRKQAE